MGYTVKELSKKNPFYISKERRLELEHFCKQYDEWKRKIKEVNFTSYGNRKILEIHSTDVNDPTYEKAVRVIKYTYKIHLIEDILAGVINEYMDENRIGLKIHNLIFNEMLKLITEGGSYDNSRLPDYISEYKYRQLRQQFFYILSERRD